MSEASRITVEADGHVLLIGVNRPEKRNAFDVPMLVELATAYERLADDDELRVGVLFAHGDHFSAGLDLASVGYGDTPMGFDKNGNMGTNLKF